MDSRKSELLQAGRFAVQRCGRWRGPLVAVFVLGLLAIACGGDEEPAALTGQRTTISLALLDDPGRRAALYAIEQGIVTSDSVDVNLTYLPLSAISDAASARQYDAVETAAVTVAQAAAAGFEFIVLSAGLQDLDGTFLFVRADSDVAGPGDLRGKTVAVASVGGTPGLETRYLLMEGYGLDVSPEGGDVTFIESPGESLPALLRDGEVDAAVVQHLGAFQLLEDGDFRVLSHVAEEVRALAGTPAMDSILVTYPEVAEQKSQLLSELNRLMAESVTYFRANREDVIQAVAAEQEVDPEFLRWWWERHELPLGDLSVEVLGGLQAVWEAAKALGDVEGYPDLATVVFNPEAVTPTPGD